LKSRYSRDLSLFAGAGEAVADLAGRFRLGLASGSPIELIEHALATVGIRECFEVVVSADEVSHGKPEPDVYLLACGRLKANPARSAAVEDSANGIQAAAAAGLAVIAIPNSEYPPAEGAMRLARVVLPSISELTVDVVAALS
jgi:beta-phosphoglucomutase-like phosphatase (HAD superfamily)